ncbi:MAG: hypothetical protein ICV65_06210 [Flavisolibacter sp.]|nr:hypothetical protein [Flavisolibacter sp.]
MTEDLLDFRQKRKWQIALRRYVLEEQLSSFYAPFFGLDIKHFRSWIELQFDETLNWDNFSSAWQFDHIVPVAYFDFSKEDDMRLCWNFINIRVEKLELNKNRGNRIDVLAAKTYFENLYAETNYPISRKMVEKIEAIEVSQIRDNEKLPEFIIQNTTLLQTLLDFSSKEYEKLNKGMPIDQVVAEKEFLRKLSM